MTETVPPSVEQDQETGSIGDPDEGGFDFEPHRQAAIDAYQPVVGLYSDFAHALFAILQTRIDTDGIKVYSIDARGKELEEFGRKAAQPDEENPSQPKYRNPMQEITDLAGVRVITFFLSTVDRIDPIISAEFEVLEKTDKSALLQAEEKLGYHSVHYVVRLKDNRRSLPEYARFDGLVAEIQVRTILQHAWAEIEHDIQYKAVATLPAEIRRRFMTLAGLLEIGDREFQALEDEDIRLRLLARESVAAGRLGQVEITPDALKSYLDRKLGPDGRMSDFSYEWTARLLRRLGFRDLEQVDTAIAPYDDDQLSRIIYGSRHGQLTRFEDVLLAAMGEAFLSRHPWRQYDWFTDGRERRLRRMRAEGIEIGEYVPEGSSDEDAPPTPLF